MTPEQTLDILKLIAAADHRTVGEPDVVLWHAIIGPLDFTRCQQAVISHFRHQPGVWLQPGHIWKLAVTGTDGNANSAVDQSRAAICEHGAWCSECKLIHQPYEPCAILVKHPELHALIAEAFTHPNHPEGEGPAMSTHQEAS